MEGLGYGRWMWQWQADPLAEEYRTIVVDNRGTGDSDVLEDADEREAVRYRMEPAMSGAFWADNDDLIEQRVDWRLAGDESLTLDELTDFLDGRLARFNRPRHLAFVGTMPTSGSSKIDRQAVTERFGES